MTAKKSSPSEQPQVATYADHQVITPPNRLGAYVRRAARGDRDDPVARAEHALQKLSVQFDDWMNSECDRLSAAHETALRAGFSSETRDALYRAAHDIKGAGGTYGYPAAAAAAESLCRIIDHAPVLRDVPADLIANHIQAILAIVREHARINAANVAETLSRRLRGIADEYLAHVNRDRPEHLEAILAPTLAPAG